MEWHRSQPVGISDWPQSSLREEGITPTTPLSSALRFSALPMRERRLVIAPLDPGHEGEALLNRRRLQG